MHDAYGWPYLDRNRWADISREERFFCAHLYALSYKSPRALVAAINKANVDVAGWEPLQETHDWEVGFEVCFFRDLRHSKLLRRKLENVSLKRTFDLALFSERRIVLIEAKAQQGFEGDVLQLAGFKADLANAHSALVDVAEALPELRLDLILLASTPAVTKLTTMIPETHYSLTWAQLFNAYEDKVLERAEKIYGDTGGTNSDGRMGGLELWYAYIQNPQQCPKFVGRGGGAIALQSDLPRNWKTRRYEVSSALEKPDNRNWFPLADFISTVEPHVNA